MKLYDLVKKILLRDPQARNSDKYLIWEVYKSKHGDTVRGAFLLNRDRFMDMPPAESITRARRKVQENHPELRARKQVEEARKEKEATKGMFAYHEEIN